MTAWEIRNVYIFCGFITLWYYIYQCKNPTDVNNVLTVYQTPRIYLPVNIRLQDENLLVKVADLSNVCLEYLYRCHISCKVSL